jgi:microcystin-dependent protein
MSEPFLAEIRMMSFNFAPQGWALCNGQFLPINQNQALFSLMGTTYGGNGQTNFALPDLRGRIPIHVGAGHTWGERAGEENHTLTVSELPMHTHALYGSSTPAETNNPNTAPGTVLASVANAYTTPSNLVAMSPASVTNNGGSQPHQNMQPYLVLTFCIALQGIFPSQT